MAEPNKYTSEQLEKALRKADAAGDTEAAREIAKALQEQSAIESVDKFAKPMSLSRAASVAGRQGREWGASDEAAGVRKMAGVPDWASRAYEAVNPMAPFVNIGLGIGGMAGEASGKAPQPYVQGRDEARAELAQARSDRPVTSFVSELAGGVAYPAGALKMGAPILGQTVKMGAIGGAQGAAYGYAASEGDTEDRLTTGAIGGVLGAGVGGAMPSLAAAIVPYFRSGKGGVAQFSDWLSGKVGLPGGAVDKANEEIARAAILRSAERSKMTPEKILSEIERLGDKPAVLAEVIGQDAVNALSALTRRPGTTPQKAQAIIEDRFGGFVDRAQGDLEQATGFQRGAFAQGVESPAVAEEIASRQAAAKPVYAEAFGQFPKVVSDRLSQLSQGSPLLKTAMAKAQKALANEATSAGRAVDEMPELQFWDLVKRELDAEETAAKAKPGGEEAVRQIEIIRKPLVDELDAITGGIYARARELGGEAPRLRSAFTSGQRALGAKPAGAIEAEVGAMNPQDQPWFRAGMTGDISTRIDKGLGPTRFRVPDVQKKVRAGFGEEPGNAFLRNMEAEASLRETGARWAPRMQSVTGTVLESGPEDFAADGLTAVGRLMSGDKLGFLRDISGWMRRRGYNQAQIDAMGDILLSNPQEGLKRLGIQLPQGGPPAGGAAGGAVGAGFGPSSQMPENAFSQTMSNGQTQPAPTGNAFSRNERGSVDMETAASLLYGSGGAMSGTVIDYNQDGKTDWQDMVAGGIGGSAVGFGLSRTRNIPTPKGGANAVEAAEDYAQAASAIASKYKPKPVTRAATEADWEEAVAQAERDLRDWGSAKFKISKGDAMGEVVRARSGLYSGPDEVFLNAGEEVAAAALRAKGIDPDPVITAVRGDRLTNAELENTRKLFKYDKNQAISKEQMAEEFGDEVAAYEQMKPPTINAPGLGNAFAESILGGSGGSALGMRTDLNGDGVIDQQDALIGAAGGTVGVPAMTALMRRGGNAFAPQSRTMGAGAPKTPQQAMRAELPGSPEYEAAVAKGLDMSTPARMARAKEMGFDTENVAYRGMTREYDPAKAGNFQMFTSSPEDAGEFAGNGAFDGGNVVAAYLRKGRNLQVNGGGNNFNSVPVSQLPADVRAKLHPSIGSVARTDEIAYAAKQAGYDSVSIKNVFDNAQGEIPRKPRPVPKDDIDQLLADLEAGGFDMSAKGSMEIAPEISKNYDPVTVDVIFDPSNIRSVHAAFDPDKAASPILTAGLGGGGRKPPPDSPEAITEAVRGISRSVPPTPPGGPVIPPRGNMRGVLQAPERVPPASPMAGQVPPPLPPRPVSNRVPTSNMPNATEMGLMAGTGAAIGGAFLMEKANDPATFGLASFDQLPPDHPLRDPQYRQMALMAQMKQPPKAPPPIMPGGVLPPR